MPARAYNDWNKPPPGYLKIDLLAHCGDSLRLKSNCPSTAPLWTPWPLLHAIREAQAAW